MPRFMPRYADYSQELYRGYRGLLSHSYSVRGFGFVDTETYRHRHLRVEGGDRVLHLESFLDDLDQAWSAFVRRVEAEDDFRERVLARTQAAPLLTIVEDEELGHASVAMKTTRVVATSFAAAPAASGSPAPGWRGGPLPTQLPPEPPPEQPAKMAIPKSGKRKRNKR